MRNEMPDETPARDEVRTIRASNETAGRKGETRERDARARREMRRETRSRTGRDDAGKKSMPTCELAYLPTCQLANLLLYFMSCYTYYAFSWIR